jgi:hypothetical protein
LNDDNAYVEGTEALKLLVLDYFSNLLSSEVQATDPIMLENFQPRVTDFMNERLTRFKAPGPDGLHVVFYKQFWDVCGAEITHVHEVLLALNSGGDTEGWNDTPVVLIPKVDDPERITQFRSINLCNVIYKIISKMLALRL